jgi:hypothetical protein
LKWFFSDFKYLPKREYCAETHNIKKSEKNEHSHHQPKSTGPPGSSPQRCLRH